MPPPPQEHRRPTLPSLHRPTSLSHAVRAPCTLQKLSEELEEWEQTEEQDSLKAVAAVLGSAKLLRHRDGDVKLLSACCLSDVLRIFAPESPYENETLKMVFELFISQLRGLQDDEGASFARYTYLVERLAMVKSFVLMLDLNFDDLVRQLVEVLLESASEAHPIRVSGYMMSIIVTTLEVSLSPQPSHTKPAPNPNPNPHPNPHRNPTPHHRS